MPYPILDVPISPLRQRLIDDMNMRRFSRETQRNYLRDIGRLATFLGRSPDTATADDLRRFQIEQQEDGVPVPTMNSIVSALRFFFTQTLDRPDLARRLVRLNASIVEYLAGMPVVKVFNRTGDSFAETGDAVRSYVAMETEWARDYVPLGGTFYTLVLANIVVILPVGLALLHAGSIDLPTLLLFVILGANYSQPLIKLFNQFHTLAHISMGAMLVTDLLETAPQADTGARVELADHDVSFEGVGFGYGAQDALHDVTFVARTSEVTALVGPSGSGKSTIASLVPRFRDVRSGRVTIGGVDVREIGLGQLMDTVAFVFQDTFLFSDTIAANIRFGKPDATDAEVEAAAKAARAHDFIATLPHGYATHLGEQGHSLSGGERQRIAIARAMLKNAPIIVLDEATAFADPDNEAAIQEAIGALISRRTLIVVAHRLHTIVDADRIVVVDGGGVAESGRHEELVAHGGLYARLWDDYTHAQAVTLRPVRRKKSRESVQ